jgi:predicted transcriptional regulator
MRDIAPKTPKELVEALEGMGLTQTEIADLTAVSQPTIARIKSGKHADPKWSTVEVLRALYEAKTGNG